MKKHIKLLSFLFVATIIFSSCSQRLIDFTIISSKSHSLSIDKTKGKATEGKSMAFMGFGVTIKDAMDDALENAGPGYDLLVDGVVRSKTYPFYLGYTVDGVAVSSSDLKVSMGDVEFKKWCEAHNIFDPSTAVVQN
jgi:hypothetical protein